jgi:hypothetical protein
MIEFNPALTPAAVKHILISTAKRIAGTEVIRQGYGVVDARRALEAARREQHSEGHQFFCPPRIVAGSVEFAFHDDRAASVSLAGDFNGWRAQSFAKDEFGVWRVRTDIPPAGRYQYKLVIDGTRWIEDPANLMKESDGYGGFNSVLTIG